MIQSGGLITRDAVEIEPIPEIMEASQENVLQALPPNRTGDANPERELTLEEELSAAVKAVRDLPPCLPSICFFTFLNTYQG